MCRFAALDMHAWRARPHTQKRIPARVPKQAQAQPHKCMHAGAHGSPGLAVGAVPLLRADMVRCEGGRGFGGEELGRGMAARRGSVDHDSESRDVPWREERTGGGL